MSSETLRETYLDRLIKQDGTFSPQQHRLAIHIHNILKGKYYKKDELLTKLKEIGTTHNEQKVFDVVRKLKKIDIVCEYDGELQAVCCGN